MKSNTLSDIQYITPCCYAGFMVLKTGTTILSGDRKLVLANDGEFPEWHVVHKKLIGKRYEPRRIGTIIVRAFRVSARID